MTSSVKFHLIKNYSPVLIIMQIVFIIVFFYVYILLTRKNWNIFSSLLGNQSSLLQKVTNLSLFLFCYQYFEQARRKYDSWQTKSKIISFCKYHFWSIDGHRSNETLLNSKLIYLINKIYAISGHYHKMITKML